MEPVIAILAPHVIDQIAAGEVIERPASVVKELVDNAIDAGATTITVEASGGGRALVRVTDDGCGMSAQSAVLAFERHATSKLRSVDDLWGLVSMGFRGEALPSIASVSRTTLTTRRSGDDAATRIVFEAGRLTSVSEVGAPVGTTVEVVDLLHNLPARLKFLKGEATEASHITDLVAKFAMAYPRLHLRLKHNGRTALDAPPDRDGLARVQALLGPRIAPRLFAVSGEESGVRVEAYLAAPELAQATARGVQLFVGRRPVRDRGVLHALSMGYGELVPRGRYPVAVVLLDIPAGAVDVNVHPQKLEVRFTDAAAVTAAVRHIVQNGVHAARWREEGGGQGPVQMLASVAPPTLPFDGHAATKLAERQVADMRARQVSLGFGPAVPTSPAAWSVKPAEAPATREPDRPSLYDDGRGPRDWARALRERTAASREAKEARAPQPVLDRRFDELGAAARGRAAEWPRGVVDGPQARLDDERDVVAPARGVEDDDVADAPRVDDVADAPRVGPVDEHVSPVLPGLSSLAASAPACDPSAPGTGFFARLRYLGQLDLTYLACEGDGELVLIDQHAAHERVELGRLRARHAGGDLRVAVQRMLFPVELAATPAQLALVGRLGALLAQVGFEVAPAGPASLALSAVPAGIRHGDPAQLLRALLEEWAEDGAPSEAERLEALLGEIACHSVVRAGDRLATGEAESLLRALDSVDLTLPAPHGKAVLLRLPLAEIGRRFGR